MSVFRPFLVNRLIPILVHFFFFGAFLSERYLGFSYFVKKHVYKEKQSELGLSWSSPPGGTQTTHAHACAHTHTCLRANLCTDTGAHTCTSTEGHT